MGIECGAEERRGGLQGRARLARVREEADGPWAELAATVAGSWWAEGEQGGLGELLSLLYFL